MKKIILGAVIILTVVFIQEARAEGIKEGKWSITVVTKVQGMEGQAAEAAKAMEDMSPEEKAMMQQMMGGMGMNANGITTTITKCVTNENPVPETEENCHETHSINGNTVNFETICDDSKSTGQVTYEGDSMRGTINSHATIGGQETDSTIEISGQYVGPCNE